MKKIAVIGGGRCGCHTARVLSLEGHDVTLFEKHEKIFKGTSGKLGLRLHMESYHFYSEETRKCYQKELAEFVETYPDLVVEHFYSIYGLRTHNEGDEAPKIDLETFRKVLKEFKFSREIDPIKWGYTNLQSAFNIEEPSILLGNSLRENFEIYLQDAGVKVLCGTKVNKLIKKKDNKILVVGEKDVSLGVFDNVVNATDYQSLLSPPETPPPFELDIIYKLCIVPVYKDLLSEVLSLPPFSFTAMDERSTCITPYITNEEVDNTYRKYFVMDNKYTIIDSYKTIEEANSCLAKIDEEFVKAHVQPKCEAEMQRVWPRFGAFLSNSTERQFQFVDWKSVVIAEINTNPKLSSGATFARDNIVYVIPGKVNNIFDVAREALALINGKNVLQQGEYQYIKNGVLYNAVSEITQAVDPKIKNTHDKKIYVESASRIKQEEKNVLFESKQNSDTSTQKLPNNNVVSLLFQPLPKTRSQESLDTSSISKTDVSEEQIKSFRSFM